MELDVSLLSAALWSLLLRLLVATFPYSGHSQPPMFGDYEAQRHWMEVTTQLPLKEWYVNSTANDLQYWGLDYPPLTAYHSWLCGKVSELFNPEWTALNTSRGYESAEHKLFMRYSVLVSDIIVFYPAVLYWASLYTTRFEKIAAFWTLLINPALILIDHGHFQYNGVCLGLFVWSVALVKSGHFALSAVAFSLALNFKQIALYFAVPVFIHLLRACFMPALSFRRLLVISVATVATFSAIWLPFFHHGSWELVEQVLLRVFPLHRGIYEDKVANFWSVTSVLVKYKKLFSAGYLARLALGTTAACLIPSSAMLCAQKKSDDMIRRNMLNFKLALFNAAMAFFLFSYQVHEKSILFPVMALSLVSNEYPEFVLYFTGIACFSLVPLLKKDGLLLAFAPLLVQMFLLLHKIHIEGIPERRWNRFYLLRIIMTLSLLVACAQIGIENFIPAPARYPELYVLCNYAFSFGHFVLFFMYGHILQWRCVGSPSKQVYLATKEKVKAS